MDYLEIHELYHHGVKGQKWGVRNYQEPNGTRTKKGKEHQSGLNKTEKALLAIGGMAVVGLTAFGIYKYGKYATDTVVKAGESIQRVGKSAGSLHDEFYASNNTHDNKRYEGMLPNHIKENLGSDVSYKNTYKVDKDIKVASDKNAKQVYKQLIKEGKIKGSYLSYDEFNRQLVSRNDDSKAFYEKLKDLGYGAVGDVNDRKYSGYNTKNPLIFFGDSKSKVTLSSTTKLSNDAVKYNAELGKANLEGLAKSLGTMGVLGGSAVYGKTWYDDIEKRQYSQYRR